MSGAVREGGRGASPPPPDAPGAAPDGVGLGQAEAALIEHYPRLVRLAYLVLPHSLGRHRRVLAAHALAQRALPRGKTPEGPPVLPAQRDGEEDPGYAYLRLRVLRAALDAGRPGRFRRLPRTAPRLLPQVVGLRLFPRAGESAELALEQELSALPPAARAAYALRRLDGLEEAVVRGLLTAAGASERQAGAAWRSAAELPLGPELADPCSLQARPTDLLRRRQYARTALFGAAALAVAGGALAALPGGWGPDGPAAPPYAENAAAEAALDPQGLRRIPEDVWRGSARTDFSVWPARGSAVGDTALLRRALAVWARPGPEVSVSATPGTQTGPAPGPAQLLFAGEAGGVSVVLLHDGLRLVRYAEPVGGEGTAALDFARVDGADLTGASAVVVGREDGNTRFLTAPWVSEAGVRELTDAGAESEELPVGEDGVTGPVRTPVGAEEAECAGFPVLELTAQGAERPLLLADLGELAPALLTSGAPGASEPASASEAWERLACHLPAMAGGGVRSVNAWEFAEQNLPDGAGRAQWVCSRAETWRGVGSRTFAQFLPPPARPGEPAVVTAVAEDATACGPRDPAVLSGVVWRSPARSWYLVAAASEPATGITAHGDVTGETTGRTLTLPAKEGDQPHLTAHRADGGDLPMLG